MIENPESDRLLVAASASTPLATLLDRDWPHVGAAASRETAASLAIRHDVPALAVLDHGGAFLGALSATAVMAILRDEHLEDLHHMVGILGRSEQAKSALTAAEQPLFCKFPRGVSFGSIAQASMVR